jgi:DNA repair protein RadC
VTVIVGGSSKMSTFSKSISVYAWSRMQPYPSVNPASAIPIRHTAVIQNLMLTRGQPDREQFVVALLNAKNNRIGLNIVSVGVLLSAPVHPRKVLKPAMLVNSSAMILCHNHTSNDISSSTDDLVVTRKIIKAADFIGIQVHNYLIIDIENERFFSFADEGIIQKIYDDILPLFPDICNYA